MYNRLDLERKWSDFKNNCDYYFSRIMSYPLCPPEHVYFSLTNRCNLRCKMCNITSSPSKEEEELSSLDCKKIIGQISDLRVNHLIFSGGEPLLRKDLLDLVAYAVYKKIKMVDIITNGYLVNEETAQQLIKSGINHITVSIDGMEETDDFIRGKGSFKEAIKAIDVINNCKRNNLPTVGINFTIMNCNIDQMLPMIDLASSSKCNIIVFQPMLFDNANMKLRENNELWVSQENIPKLEKTIKEVIKLKKSMRNLSIHVNEQILELIGAYFSGKPLGGNLKCYEAIVRIVISWKGELWSCCGVYGNLRTKPLRSIWISPQAKRIRQVVKRCQNHCLQSCIYLNELTDVYAEIDKLKKHIEGVKERKKYEGMVSELFKKYNFLLARKSTKHSITSHGNNGDTYGEELMLETKRSSAFMKK